MLKPHASVLCSVWTLVAPPSFLPFKTTSRCWKCELAGGQWTDPLHLGTPPAFYNKGCIEPPECLRLYCNLLPLIKAGLRHTPEGLRPTKISYFHFGFFYSTTRNSKYFLGDTSLTDPIWFAQSSMLRGLWWKQHYNAQGHGSMAGIWIIYQQECQWN